jgi:pilus assembly protein Flp/PilA
MRAVLASFVQNESGATAIEYGLMASMIAVGAILAFTAAGGGLQNLFTGVGNRTGESLTNASNSL